MPNSKLVYTTSGSNLCGTCGRSLHKCKCEREARPIGTNTARTPQIQLEKKSRGGKEVTVVSHLGLSGAQLSEILQLIKRRLGTGGTLKNQSLEIQGNRVAEVRELLSSQGILDS
jgi:translation initiation factor 1